MHIGEVGEGLQRRGSKREAARAWRRQAACYLDRSNGQGPLFAHSCHCAVSSKVKNPPFATFDQESCLLHQGIGQVFPARVDAEPRTAPIAQRGQWSRCIETTCAARATSRHLWRCANSAKECQSGTRVPRSRDIVPTARMQHVFLFPASQGGWGPPVRSCHRGGVGGISVGGQKNVKFGLLATPAEKPAVKGSELV
jgi:hypothetical protein